MKELDPDSSIKEAFSESIGFLLGRSAQIFKSKLESALAALDLSVLEYVCLKMIALKTGSTQGSLGEFYGIEQSMMVAIVDRMESKDLVVRERNKADRRSYILNLTLKGNKILARAQRLAASQQRDFLSPLTDEQWGQFRLYLNKLVWQKLDDSQS